MRRQFAAAAIDDVLGLEVVAVHGRVLVLAADHRLLGVEHAAAFAQVRIVAVTHGEQEQPRAVEIAETVVGDVPAEIVADDRLRFALARLEL